MCVAIWQTVMVLSELAIIYLATAAPFGVSRFLEQNAQGTRRLRAAFESLAASFAWPMTAMLFLFKCAKAWPFRPKVFHEATEDSERRVEHVKRSTVNALRAVEDLLERLESSKGEAERHVFFAARVSVECYTGLALACAGANEEDAPSKRELELCRIAGRTGEDLLLAGRCIHRRNVARLLSHLEHARVELVHALAAAGEAAHASHLKTRPLHSAEQNGAEAVKQISEALLNAFSRAIELLSLFDDRTTIVSVARLFDAECARLRRLETLSDAYTSASVRPEEGVGQCTTQAVHTAFATQPQPTQTSITG